MGSGFSVCTIEEAAQLLGKKPRTIKTYIKEGFIRKTLNTDGKVALIREDVISLLLEKDKALPAFTKTNFFGLINRIRKLEQDMLVVRRILDIKNDPLRVKKEEALALYNEATISLQIRLNKWTEEEISTWSNLFDRFDASTLEAMPDKNRPWEVFYKLCTALIEYLPHNENTEILARLEVGRKHLRNEAILWTEMGKGTFPKEAYFRLNDEKEALLEALLKT